MKFVAGILYSFAAVLGAFGYWGVFTRSGRREYDEMAGFIPGIALLIAVILLLIALILSLLAFLKQRRIRTKEKALPD
jgi:uncharacterized membrane protein